MYEEFTKHVNMDITKEIEEFVKEGVFGDSEYLFLKKVNEKIHGYCSKCNSEYEVEGLEHNDWVICPICGSKVTVKHSRYGRKSCKNEACFYYFEKSIIDPKIVVCKGYYVSKNYIDYKNPKTEYLLEAIYIFNEKCGKLLKMNYSYFYGESWSEKKSVFDFNQGWLANKMCYCSFESIGKAIQETSYQYLPYKLFQGHYSMVKLFEEFTKHPWIEQVCKIGFDSIIKNKLEGQCLYDCLNYKGKNVFKILRLSRRDVKEIKKSGVNITPLFLRLYQLQAKENCGFSPEQVEEIERNYGNYYYAISNIAKYTTIKKAIRYMEKQFEKYKKHFYSKSNIAITWSDYIDDCSRLEMNLKDESVLFPKNVYAAHQNTITQVKIRGNEIFNNKIINRAKNLEKYCFEYNGLFIRPAASSNELIEEGKALNHCVGTYTEKYAAGKTNIFLIRKISKPNKPFYTMELKDDRILQTRGNKNCAPTEEVKEFIEAFSKAKLNKKSKVKIPA